MGTNKKHTQKIRVGTWPTHPLPGFSQIFFQIWQFPLFPKQHSHINTHLWDLLNVTSNIAMFRRSAQHVNARRWTPQRRDVVSPRLALCRSAEHWHVNAALKYQVIKYTFFQSCEIYSLKYCMACSWCKEYNKLWSQISALFVGVFVAANALTFLFMWNSIFILICVISGVFAGPISTLFVLGIYMPALKTWVSIYIYYSFFDTKSLVASNYNKPRLIWLNYWRKRGTQ